MLPHEAQENAVPLPLRQGGELCLRDPRQLALVAVPQGSAAGRGVEQVHVFALPAVADEGHDAAVAVLRQLQSRFLAEFAADAVVRAFVFLKFSADADPFVVIRIVFLFVAVQQEPTPVLLQIAKRGILHSDLPKKAPAIA